jgi:1,4-alpha-glucan branching enzyme
MALKKETKPVKAAAKPKAKSVAKPAAKAVAAKGKTSEVEVKTYSPASGSVAIAGDFNGWKPLSLKKGKNGTWSAKIKLSKGTHQYKLIYDGQYWQTDNSNPERISDGHGGENSILRV